MSLARLIYSSEINLDAFECDRPVTEQLQKLLKRAQDQNRKVHVTGILIYSAGHFIQVLEGHPLVLRRLFAKIAADSRHRAVEELACFSCDHRLFSHWFMGMLNLDDYQDIDPELLKRFKEQARFVLTAETAKEATVLLLQSFQDRLELFDPVSIG